MSRRHQLEQRLQSLADIGEVMGAMKNLALMETHKLARFLTSQRRAVETIERSGADFLAFHPQARAGDSGAHDDIYLMIGSERGFCGNFNERLIAALERLPGHTGCRIVTVGARLGARLGDDPRVVARLAGAAVVEEVESALAAAAGALNALPDLQTLRLAVIRHVADDGDIGISRLLPWRPAAPRPARAFACPPLLYGGPRQFLDRLTGQYLFAALHEFLCGSLMAENQQRVRHLDAAVRRIDDETVRIAQQRNRLRQEEITEEIEIILLGVDAPQ